MPETPEAPTPRVLATHALRSRGLWLPAAVVLGLVAFLLSMAYMGGVVNPRGAMRDLPVGVVNNDRGATVDGGRVAYGERIADGILKGPNDGKVSWQKLSEKQAREQMSRGKLYGALVVPEDFSSTLLALPRTASSPPHRPTLTVLTNPASGSSASSMASSAATEAGRASSATLGKELTERTTGRGGPMSAAQQLMLADPLAIRTVAGHPLGSHSGMGLTAFFYAMLLTLCGFLGANVITGLVDSGFGFAASDIGPWRTQQPALRVDRRHTLMTAWGLMAGLAAIMATLMMVACVGVLDMDADHLGLLWVFSYCAIAVVGLGCLSIMAAIGTPGILVSTFVFLALALPSSGATIPLEAVPSFYRHLAVFEPLRQITDGVRSILYFGARGDAGLDRAWLMMGIGLVVALVIGYAATAFYDRKGLRRAHAHPAATATTTAA
ncbi:DUF3533 domain-containing protein [Streptomyces sp. NPDC048636]|uniref:YhgE/Pip domain-containing protein n=1 Tax=Streptomyces sp. NPDC048636 TaxID=3155762 RepID=UPI003447E392